MVRFTKSHEWIEGKDGVSIVGITNFAQEELGEIVSIELPKVGRNVKMGEEIAVLESTKAAADVYAPISGKIVAINESLKQNPSFVNQFAESKGWLFKIEPSHPKEIENLLTQAEYQKLTNG